MEPKLNETEWQNPFSSEERFDQKVVESKLFASDNEVHCLEYNSGNEVGDSDENSSDGTDDDSYYCEPWEILPEKVHLATITQEVVPPLFVGTREKPKKKVKPRASRAGRISPNTRRSSSALNISQKGKKAKSRASFSVTPDVLNIETEEKEDEPEFLKERNAEVLDWDNSFLTITPSNSNGLKHINDSSGSASYMLTITDSELSVGHVWIWVRVSLPSNQPNAHFLQFGIGERFHGSSWPLRTTLCSPGTWHWQRYPRKLSLSEFILDSARFRIFFSSFDLKLSALWVTSNEMKSPPESPSDSENDFPLEVLHCLPNIYLPTYDSKRPWTAHRKPDSSTACNRLEEFQRFICVNEKELLERLEETKFMARFKATMKGAETPAERKVFRQVDKAGNLALCLKKLPEESHDTEQLSNNEDSGESEVESQSDDNDDDDRDEISPEEMQLKIELEKKMERWNVLFDDIFHIMNDDDRAQIDCKFEQDIRLQKLVYLQKKASVEEESNQPTLDRLAQLGESVSGQAAQAARLLKSAMVFDTVGQGYLETRAKARVKNEK